jgi:hypothetical protein
MGTNPSFQELHEIEGLQFIPVNAKKIPTVKGWQTSDADHDLTKSYGVGLVCGKLSGGLEVIDIDEKYDLTGKLFENYKRLVHSVDEGLLGKLVVQKTKGGGHHLIYRCSVIAGNIKLANRPTTKDERDQTYKETYEAELVKSKTDDEAKNIAQKAADSDKVRVLFETRGEGGYIMCWPSQGYELTYRDYYGITEITPEERETLHGIARQFNEVFEESVAPKIKPLKKDGLSSFEDYNERGDVVSLLENHGWRIVQQKGAKTVFLRPGQTTSTTSGNYDHDKKWFSVFTTSTEFNPCHAYLPYAVFAMLECNNDFSAASKKLYDLGFGEKNEPKKEETRPSTRAIPSRVNPTDNDYSFLAEPEDYGEYLHQVRTGTLQMGKTTGCPSLDEYFLFKEGNVVMTNGIDNTGKSVFTWWLSMVAAMYHGWRGIIFSSENTLGSFMRKMIQFYWGKPLHGNYAMNQTEFEIAKSFVEKHFALIKAQEDLYNYKDIINMVKKTLSMAKYHFAMIDPYNSLKVDLSGFSKLSTHEYHYEALSELKAFGQKNKFGWIINNHAVTAALRAKDGDHKYPVAPRKEDTEGGGKFANKADEFITIHRLTQHPTDWMITEVHVRKVKDHDTGGRPSPFDSPIKFEMYRNGCAFIENNGLGERGEDPISNWHDNRKPKQKELVPKITTQVWTPYKEDDREDIGF